MKISQLFAIPLLAAIAIPFAAQASVKTAIAQSQMFSAKTIVAQNSTDVDVQALIEEVGELQNRPCDAYNREVTQENAVINICGARIGGRDVLISASVTFPNSSAVFVTFHSNGKFSSYSSVEEKQFIETQFFDRRGNLQAELKNGVLKTTFSRKERNSSEGIYRAFEEVYRDVFSKFK